jgi:hypothetical protein
MGIRLCPECGEIDGSTEATICAACSTELVDTDAVDDPRQLDDDDQIIYELAEWTLEQRTAVAEVVAEASIPHAWDGDELIVHVDHEAAVDRLIEPIEHLGGGAPAVAAELAEDAELTEYDLADWEPEARTELVARLIEAGVPHRWEESLLLVTVDDEDVVDEMLDDLELGGDEASIADDGQETPFAVLEALFLAADRLKDNPLDGDGLTGLVSALDEADERRPPYGIDMPVWKRVLGFSDEIAEAIAGEGERDEVAAMEAASELHRLLRNVV